jgi:hypothetical protein
VPDVSADLCRVSDAVGRVRGALGVSMIEPNAQDTGGARPATADDTAQAQTDLTTTARLLAMIYRYGQAGTGTSC